MFDKFWDTSFLEDVQFAIAYFDFESACGEGRAKDKMLGGLCNIDKAACASNDAVELRNINVALGINLCST
ncbi:MAG: hypothetical protein JKX85_04885 [Phycisphaeraceae bacterium]|nr:hypothetical protein [Phycisphaeraceae bacterium]